MNLGQFLTSLPTVGLFTLIISICFVSASLGILLARRLKKAGLSEPEGPLGTAVGSTLGLFAFMLGFTFSFTEMRFNERRNLVIEQAGALSGCYYRTTFIPEKQRKEIRKLLAEYSYILASALSKEDLDADLVTLKSLQSKMWKVAFSLRDEPMDSELRVMFLGALGNVTGVFRERRVVAISYRIPNIIWTSVILLSALSLFILGYQFGFGSSGRIVSVVVFSSALALVIIMIADMDSIVRTRFKISQDPINESARMIQKNEAHPEF